MAPSGVEINPQFYWGKKDSFSKSCAVCGLSSEGTADETTFFSGNALDHDWGVWTQNSDEKTHTRICKRDTSHTETENCHGGTATCTAKAVCEVCKAEYGEELPHDFTAETVDAKYLKSAATCTKRRSTLKDTPALDALKASCGAPISMGRGEIPVRLVATSRLLCLRKRQNAKPWSLQTSACLYARRLLG